LGSGTIQIINPVGTILYNEHFDPIPETVNIDIRNICKSVKEIYFITINSESNSLVKKFIY